MRGGSPRVGVLFLSPRIPGKRRSGRRNGRDRRDRLRILGGGLRFMARRVMHPHACAPASRGPFRKRPCIERVDAPLPARRPTEAYPLRYGEGGQRSRSGCSDPRMPGSEGMAPWRSVPLRPPPAAAAPETWDPRRCGGFREAGGTFLIHLRDAGEECPHQAVQLTASGTGSERAKIASVAEGKPPRARGPGHLHSPDGARNATGGTHGYAPAHPLSWTAVPLWSCRVLLEDRS
jgi:hypothetical protein